MEQGSCEVRLQQVEHRRTSRSSEVSASARSRAYCGGDSRMWKASRWAVFSPTPGSLASRTVSRAIGSAAFMLPGKFPAAREHVRSRDHSREQILDAGKWSALRLHQLLRGTQRGV